MLATVLYERNDLKGAVESARLSVELADLGEEADHKLGAYFCWAHKLIAEGDLAGADTITEKLDQTARHPSVSPAGHAAYRLSLALQRGDLASAIEWGRRLSEFGEGAVGTWNQHVPIRLSLAIGEKAAAAQRLRGLYEKAVRAGAQGYVIRVRVYQSLAAETPTEALTFLSEALTLGEPEGFVRTFADEGTLLKPLLRKALSQGITPEYTVTLLGIIESEERRRRARQGEAARVAASPEFLSQRELEVLRLVANGLSNDEIASKLVISINTTKRHVHNIFQKLNASSRISVVARARELKLI